MALEKKWLAVTTIPFTADGTSLGVVTVADTAGFKVKGICFLAANTQPVLQLQVQRVISPTQLIVGKVGTTPEPTNYIDVSAYTVLLSASIGFPEQSKNKIKPDDIEQAVYEADPVVAIREILVDEYGRFYTPDNPLPTAPVGGVVDKDWDDLILTRDPVTQDITVATYKKLGTPVRVLTLTYDSDSNLQEVKKT